MHEPLVQIDLGFADGTPPWPSLAAGPNIRAVVSGLAARSRYLDSYEQRPLSDADGSGRLDVLVRSGLWRQVLHHGWTPIASAVTIRFQRELRPFQKFRLETRLLCWDATLVVMEQIFVIDGGPRDGQAATRALFKGGLYDRKEKKFVEISRLMSLLGVSEISPAATPEVEAFLHADDQLKQAGRPATQLGA